MTHVDEPKQVVAHARTCLARMTQHGVLPTPDNYKVWYSYAAGLNPDLAKAIDEVVTEGKGFTEAVNRKLFDRFFGTAEAGATIRAAGDRMALELARVLEAVELAGKDSLSYGRTLEDVAERLQPSREVSALIGAVIAATRQMTHKTHALEVSLARSAEEMRQLREDVLEIQRDAYTDALTGLANRRRFDEHLRLAAGDALETGRDLCLVLGDVDHFKGFNDRWGHPIGDQVLRTVAATLRRNVKGRDTVARYGGEEFALLLTQASLEDAVLVADQIRVALARQEVLSRSTGQTYGTVTMSFGVARYRPGERLDALIERADRALYAAKHSGRNRVVDQDRMPALADAQAAPASR